MRTTVPQVAGDWNYGESPQGVVGKCWILWVYFWRSGEFVAADEHCALREPATVRGKEGITCQSWDARSRVAEPSNNTT